jgi:hypothetical protein
LGNNIKLFRTYFIISTKFKLMKNKFRCVLSASFIVGAFFMSSSNALAQNSVKFEQDAASKMADFFAAPDVKTTKIKNLGLGASGAMGSLMVPTGYGGSGLSLFGGIGGAFPQTYSNDPDLGASVGLCFGNPVSFLNIAASINIMDVSDFRNYSGNVVLSKRLNGGSSISGGLLNLFASKSISDFAKTSYYVAFSHSVQSMPSKTPGSSRLTYSVGVGDGRFYEKSPYDVLNGKGRYGTAVFANVSYEIIQNINVNAEWTGLNLGFSVGVRPFKSTPLSLGVGVTNLTSYSADKSNMVFSLGFPFALMR